MEISIVIPTFRPGKYLIECIDSIQRQTFPKSMFDVVIVLNGEKDPYYKSINDIIEKSNISIKLVYTKLKGVSNARNTALDSIDSEYVVFIDDDDLITEKYLEDLYSKISKNTIVVSNVKTFMSDVNYLGNDYITESYYRCKSISKYNIVKYRSFLSSACGKIIPLKLIGDNKFNIKFGVGEDSLFMFAISNNLKHIVLAEESTIYLRRLREGSASRNKMDFSSNIRTMIMTILSYSKIYLSDIRSYNFVLYLTRIMAAIILFYKRLKVNSEAKK